MKKHVLIIGPTRNEIQRTALRHVQLQCERKGMPVTNILDFANEGEDAPSFHEMERIYKYIRLQTASIIYVSERCEMVVIALEYAKEHGIQFVNWMDVDLNHTERIYEPSFIERLNKVLAPWLTNPMKQARLGN